jgi:hypothetical protein
MPAHVCKEGVAHARKLFTHAVKGSGRAPYRAAAFQHSTATSIPLPIKVPASLSKPPPRCVAEEVECVQIEPHQREREREREMTPRCKHPALVEERIVCDC